MTISELESFAAIYNAEHFTDPELRSGCGVYIVPCDDDGECEPADAIRASIRVAVWRFDEPLHRWASDMMRDFARICGFICALADIDLDTVDGKTEATFELDLDTL